MAVWNDLPLHILYIIAQYITVLEDFLSFSVVSKDCQSVIASLKNKPSLAPRYPRLMLAENKNTSVRGFVNLLTSKTVGVELPEAKGRYCVGAHYGWLFTLGFDLQINLLHPFSRQQISLPPMLAFPDQYGYDPEFTPQMVLDVFVWKVAMSASPLKGNSLNKECVIVAIYGEFGILAFAKPGDSVWTNIQTPSRVYTDVIYHRGKFYATDIHSTVIVCDIDDKCPKATVVAHFPLNARDIIQDTCRKYLVESSGDLLLVARDRGHTSHESDDEEVDYYFQYGDGEIPKVVYPTNSFYVWRLDESHDEGCDYLFKFTEVRTLGDRALFLGRNVSTSKASSNSIKGNCIYFTDDDVEFYCIAPGGGGRDTGIFFMEDGKIELAFAGKSLSALTPPIWYM